MIDTNGNFLSKQWFDWISNFENGFSRIELNNKWNFIDTNGKLISEQWFDYIYNFNKNGFAIVELKNKLNLIDTNGKLLSQQWFNSYDEAYDYLINFQ